MAPLQLDYRWHPYEWHVTSRDHPNASARATSPGRARGALLKKLRREMGAAVLRAPSLDTFHLPDEWREIEAQIQTQRQVAAEAMARAAELEATLVVALRKYRLSTVQIARILRLGNGRVFPLLHQAALRDCTKGAQAKRTHVVFRRTPAREMPSVDESPPDDRTAAHS